MRVIRVLAVADADGRFRLDLDIGPPGTRCDVAVVMAAPAPDRTYSTASRIARNAAKTSSPSQWMMRRFGNPVKLSEEYWFAVWSCFGTEIP